jgi:hypothetical protein
MPYLETQYPVLKRLDHSDRELICCYAEKYNQFSCEYSYPSLHLWHDIYQYKLSFFNEWLIVFDTQSDFILMPMGENITLPGLLELSMRLNQDGYSGDISNVPPEFIVAQPELSYHFDIENERELAEYIYSTEKLFTLSGKKLRKKKNLISQFCRNFPDYRVKSMDAAVRKDCLAMMESMLAERGADNKSVLEESIVIKKGFESFDTMQLEGIAIYIGNDIESRVICFSVYSRLNKDVFTIHFEKADYSFCGAAQIINWETAKALKDKCRYINREQDLGIPGLRQAKLSYEPELIYPSYFLSFKGIATDEACVTLETAVDRFVLPVSDCDARN